MRVWHIASLGGQGSAPSISADPTPYCLFVKANRFHEWHDPTRIVVEIEGGVVTAVTCDEAAEVHVIDYDNIKEADAEWLDRFAGSYRDADGVGYVVVDKALARADKVY